MGQLEQITNLQHTVLVYHFFLLSYICNKTRVRCLGHLLITHWAEQGQAYLMAERLLIVLSYLCNEHATHTTPPQHFEVMHINVNAFKEIT